MADEAGEVRTPSVVARTGLSMRKGQRGCGKRSERAAASGWCPVPAMLSRLLFGACAAERGPERTRAAGVLAVRSSAFLQRTSLSAWAVQPVTPCGQHSL